MLSWWKGKPQSTALLNGALAGLAGITPASGYVNSPASVALGLIFGAASFGAVHVMKHSWHVDDALDVSSVHGLTGVLGAIGLGLFAQLRMDPLGANGAFYGHPMQLVYQVCGVLLAIGWAGFWTIVLLRLLDWLHGGVRVGEDEEEVGLDWSEHHEIAYHKLHVLDDVSVAEQRTFDIATSTRFPPAREDCRSRKYCCLSAVFSCSFVP
jgi:Amt family ammonium transporter